MSSDCANAVLKYLVAQNRPYSATDVMQNLHKEFGKTAIQKALDELAVQGRILEKVYGKQKVYCALQQGSASREEMARELAELDADVTKTTENLRAVEQQVRRSRRAGHSAESCGLCVHALHASLSRFLRLFRSHFDFPQNPN